MERKFDNAKDVLCVVRDMEDPMKIFKEENIPEDLYEKEAKSSLKNKILELALIRYIDKEEKSNKT